MYNELESNPILEKIYFHDKVELLIWCCLSGSCSLLFAGPQVADLAVMKIGPLRGCDESPEKDRFS